MNTKLTQFILLPEWVLPTVITSSEWRLANILIGLLVLRSENMILFSLGETV